MFKIYDEPDSPSKGDVFKICEQESPNERGCLGGGGLRHPPTPPSAFVQGGLKASGQKFWLKPIMPAL